MGRDTSFDFGFNAQRENDGREGDPPTYDCMGAVKCTACGKMHGYCVEVDAQLKGYTTQQGGTMLPRSDGAESAPRSQRAGGMDYLKNEDLSTTPKEAKILAVKADTENKFGSRVVLKLALDGKIKFWGVKVKGNPNYKFLENKFGNEENEWAGQKILLGLEKEEFSEQYFARVTFPAAKASR